MLYFQSLWKKLADFFPLKELVYVSRAESRAELNFRFGEKRFSRKVIDNQG